MSTEPKHVVRVRWMTRNGPMEHEVLYLGVRSVEEAEGGGRLLLHFANYTLWLFTQHMASVQIEDAA